MDDITNSHKRENKNATSVEGMQNNVYSLYPASDSASGTVEDYDGVDSHAIPLKISFNFGLPAHTGAEFLRQQLESERAETIRKKRPFPAIVLRKLKALKEQILTTILIPLRHYIYRKRGMRLLGKLVKLSIKLNRSNFHVFVNYSGHVDGVIVSVYEFGWSKDTSRTYVLEGTLPGYGEYSKMKPKDIKNTMRFIKTLSKQKQLHVR